MSVEKSNNEQSRDPAPALSRDLGDRARDSNPEDVLDPGAVLRSARLAAGISIAQMARRLHLMARVVEAIEANDLRHFSAPAYWRGYVRNYAKLLGIDAEPLLRAYTEQQPDLAPPPMPKPVNKGEDEEDKAQRGSLPPPVLWAALFVGLLLLFAWQWPLVEQTVRDYRENQSAQSAGTAPAARMTEEPVRPVPDRNAAQPVVAGQDSPAVPASAMAPLAAEDSAAFRPIRGVPGQAVGEATAEGPAATGATGYNATASEMPAQTLPDDRQGATLLDGRPDAIRVPGTEAILATASDGADGQTVSAPTAAAGLAGFDSQPPDNPLPTENEPLAGETDAAARVGVNTTEAAVTRDLLSVRRITPTGNDELWFEFTEDCWVEVYDTEGLSLYQDLLRRRQSLRLLGRGPFQIQLGYAPGVTLEYNGEPVPLLPHTRNTVASLVVGQ